MRLKRHLLASATSIHGFRLSGAELAAGRLLRAPDGHEDDAPPVDDEDDVLELTEELEPGTPPAGEEDEGEDVLTFGDDAEEQEGDTSLVKHLRAQIRERDKRLSEGARTPRPEPIEVGEKPKIEDFDYDEEKYDEAMDAWRDRKAKKAQQERAVSEAGEEEKQAWEGELARYSEGKTKLGFKDVDDAEETVKASFDTAQQAVLIMAADDPAKLMYALGKHPARLAELAAEKNPLKLAAKIAKLEGTLKVVRRKAPAVDEPERGSGNLAPKGADKTLAKLEKEADETGDRTKLIEYRRKLKRAAEAK